ncbi:hypothetical protein CSB08_00965 [Candidatus Gracilibacteria bacterium]|nr:MAG: hypothetical protein CSB08_00965 [Candidatus Gracilibacteria bacterium]
MKKKQYIFLIMIIIILSLIFYIINYKYKEYKINNYIKKKIELNKEIREKIAIAEEIIEYKKSKAYRNKILKQQQGKKGKGEKVIYLSPEEEYNKYTKSLSKDEIEEKSNKIQDINDITKTMTIYQKWIYFLFEKDLR